MMTWRRAQPGSIQARPIDASYDVRPFLLLFSPVTRFARHDRLIYGYTPSARFFDKGDLHPRVERSILEAKRATNDGFFPLYLHTHDFHFGQAAASRERGARGADTVNPKHLVKPLLSTSGEQRCRLRVFAIVAGSQLYFNYL